MWIAYIVINILIVVFSIIKLIILIKQRIEWKKNKLYDSLYDMDGIEVDRNESKNLRGRLSILGKDYIDIPGYGILDVSNISLRENIWGDYEAKSGELSGVVFYSYEKGYEKVGSNLYSLNMGKDRNYIVGINKKKGLEFLYLRNGDNSGRLYNEKSFLDLFGYSDYAMEFELDYKDVLEVKYIIDKEHTSLFDFGDDYVKNLILELNTGETYDLINEKEQRMYFMKLNSKD